MSRRRARLLPSALISRTLVLGAAACICLTPFRGNASPAAPQVIAFAGGRTVDSILALGDGDHPDGWLFLLAQATSVNSSPSVARGWYQTVVVTFGDRHWCLASGDFDADEFSSTTGAPWGITFSNPCIGPVHLVFTDDPHFDPSKVDVATDEIIAPYTDADGDQHSWIVNYNGTGDRGIEISGTAGKWPVREEFSPGGFAVEKAAGRIYDDLCLLALKCSTAPGAHLVDFRSASSSHDTCLSFTRSQRLRSLINDFICRPNTAIASSHGNSNVPATFTAAYPRRENA